MPPRHAILTALCLALLLSLGCETGPPPPRPILFPQKDKATDQGTIKETTAKSDKKEKTETSFWDDVERIVIAPGTKNEVTLKDDEAAAYLKRFGPGSLNELEMESVDYWADGYVIIKRHRYTVRYAEVAGSEFPGILIIQGNDLTLRLRQYR
jgi:hypothetical protein